MPLSSIVQVPVSGLVNFTWSGGSTGNTNDWVAFWTIGVEPSIFNGGNIPNSWRYTYGGNSVRNSEISSSESGTIALTAPPLPGVYKVYYCINNSFHCTISTQVEVIAATIPPLKCNIGGASTSTIEHLIIIETENHSFDSILGSYCQAATDSKPATNYGPYSCESAPSVVSGYKPYVLTDEQNLAYDPPHGQSSETCMMNNGKMDQYVSGCLTASNSRNFAVADTSPTGSAAVYGSIA